MRFKLPGTNVSPGLGFVGSFGFVVFVTTALVVSVSVGVVGVVATAVLILSEGSIII